MDKVMRTLAIKKLNYPNKLIDNDLLNQWAIDNFPLCKYNFKSDKYLYIYNESRGDIPYWHACLQDVFHYTNKHGDSGFTSWHYFSYSEERCADRLYKELKKHIKKLAKARNGHSELYANWSKWIEDYENTRDIKCA